MDLGYFVEKKMDYYGNKYRDMFAEGFIRALEVIGRDLPDFSKVGRLISGGGKNCNDIQMFRTKYCPKAKACSVDPKFAPYWKFDISHIKKRVEDVSLSEINEKIPDDGSETLMEMAHVATQYRRDLQILNLFDGARGFLKEGEYLIFTEEIVRGGLLWYYDRAWHYLYNNTGIWDIFKHLILKPFLNDGYYPREAVYDYVKIAKAAGFELVGFAYSFRDNFTAIFKAVSLRE